jgi:hypothetical protein
MQALAEEPAPVRVSKTRPQLARLKPEQQDHLRERRLVLQARFRIETDDSQILQQFFDEAFDGWADQKESAQPTALPTPEKSRRGKKPEEER